MRQPKCRRMLSRNPALDTAKLLKVGIQHVSPQSVVDELPAAFRFHQASVLQLFHVMGEGGRGDRNTLPDISAGAGIFVFAPQLLQDLVSSRISKSARDQEKLSI